MNLYAESSAVLAWLLGEPSGEAIRRHLGAADRVVSSALTLLESRRALVGAVARGRFPEAQVAGLESHLSRAGASWALAALSDSVLARAASPFPHEPLRTLDAIHLASALEARRALSDLALLSLDERIRDNGRRLGFEVLP